MSVDPVCDVTAVEYAYNRTVALRGVSLTVNPAEVVAVTGPSGCGKSTLLHAAAGILRPQKGLRAAPRTGSGIARRRRTHATSPASCRHRPAVRAACTGRPGSRQRCAAVDVQRRGPRAGTQDGTRVAREGGHGRRPRRRARRLSGGQGQRVAVARALVIDPTIVLADEPTGSMDTIGGEELLELLLENARERGTSIVLVTHDNIVASRADREVRLRDGLVESEQLLQ